MWTAIVNGLKAIGAKIAGGAKVAATGAAKAATATKAYALENAAELATSAASSAFQQRTNVREAQKQRDHINKQMSNRYQQTADDMEKAGLNRILAAGASPPVVGGASANIAPPKLTEALATAQQVRTGKAQTKNLEATTANQKLTNEQMEVWIDEMKKSDTYKDLWVLSNVAPGLLNTSTGAGLYMVKELIKDLRKKNEDKDSKSKNSKNSKSKNIFKFLK